MQNKAITSVSISSESCAALAITYHTNCRLWLNYALRLMEWNDSSDSRFSLWWWCSMKTNSPTTTTALNDRLHTIWKLFDRIKPVSLYFVVFDSRIWTRKMRSENHRMEIKRRCSSFPFPLNERARAQAQTQFHCARIEFMITVLFFVRFSFLLHCLSLGEGLHSTQVQNMENKEIIVEFDFIFFSATESETWKKETKIDRVEHRNAIRKKSTIYCDRTEFISLRRWVSCLCRARHFRNTQKNVANNESIL